MDSKSPIVFIRTGDTDLALRLVRVLNQHGISGFWVTTEESEKLRQVWQVDGEIHGWDPSFPWWS